MRLCIISICLAGCAAGDKASTSTTGRPPPEWMQEAIRARAEEECRLSGSRSKVLSWGPGYQFSERQVAAQVRTKRGAQLYFRGVLLTTEVVAYAQEVRMRQWPDGQPGQAQDFSRVALISRDRKVITYASADPSWASKIPENPDAEP